MGLDMYLFKKQKGCSLEHKKAGVAFWRKADQLHNWFVTNGKKHVDNSEYQLVCESDLSEILKLCRAALADKSVDPNSSEESARYYEGIKYTIETIEYLLADTNFDEEYIYYECI